MNFALLVNPNKYYPVSYQVLPKGGRLNEPTELLGKDLTENQIKQLYYSGKLEPQPSQIEVDNYLDSL